MLEKPVFLSHKAKDFELAKKCRDTLQNLLPINVFLSEDIIKGGDFRGAIHAALDKAASFILLFTDPSENWSWCFYEAGMYNRLEDKGNGRRIYCLHLQDIPPPSPLADLQTVKAEATDIERWIVDLCAALKFKLPTHEKIQLSARKIDQYFKAVNLISEVEIKPYIWIIPPWPNKNKPNFNAPRLPAIRFENASVVVDKDSANMLGFGVPPQNYTLGQFLNILDYDSSQSNHGRPYWMHIFFQSLLKGVSADLKMQEIAYFRHEEGVVLRPVVVSVAKNKDATICKLKVRFTRTVAPPVTDQPDPVQRLADGIRLGVRTRIEVIQEFGGRMSQIYRDKVINHSPAEEVGRNFTVGSRMIKTLQAIYEEATAHGFRPNQPPPRLFSNRVQQKQYQDIRAKGVRLWDELAKTAVKEDHEGSGRYGETERLLSELKKINDEYLEMAVPRLAVLLRSEDERPSFGVDLPKARRGRYPETRAASARLTPAKAR
jgi:hypothetical protein